MPVTLRRALALATALLLVTTVPGEACCPISAKAMNVQIADQEVLIVWDAASKTEHFVRRAAFATNAKGFGFLVPTPSRPTVAEAEDAFGRLDRAIRPRLVHPNEYCFTCMTFYDRMLPRNEALSLGTTGSASVRLLEEAHVAGYVVDVLSADDPKALGDWLSAHGFDSRPEVVKWVEPYVTDHWFLCAFKYDDQAPKPSGAVAAKAVRLSFATDRPFFPYRVPADQLHGESLLRIFYVGDARVDPVLSRQELPCHNTMKTKYASSQDDLKTLLAGAVPPEAIPASGWLTTIEDSYWPFEQTNDLYFKPAAKQEEDIPTVTGPARPVYIPIDGAVVVLVVGGIVLRFKRRARAAR